MLKTNAGFIPSDFLCTSPLTIPFDASFRSKDKHKFLESRYSESQQGEVHVGLLLEQMLVSLPQAYISMKAVSKEAISHLSAGAHEVFQMPDKFCHV